MQPSGDPLHCAIEGEGFFSFFGADGARAFTRDGRFRVDERRYLCHRAGGELVPLLEVPPGHSIVSIAANGDVLACAEAPLDVPRVVGKVLLHRFVAVDMLVGDGVRFSHDQMNPMTWTPGEHGFGSLVPRAVEASNVDRTAATVHLLHHLARKQIAVLVLERLFPTDPAHAQQQAPTDTASTSWTGREKLQHAARELAHASVFGVRRGPHLRTGRAFDLAVEGEAWFAILMETGNLAYQPGACAELNAEGTLTVPGFIALQPEITLPSDWLHFRVESNGTMCVHTAGNPNATTQVGQLTVHMADAEGPPPNDNGSIPHLGTSHQTMLPGENGAGALRGGEVEVGDAGDEGLLRLAITVTQLRREHARRSGTPADRLPFALDAASAKALLDEAAADAAIWVEAWSYALCGEPEAEPEDEAARERPSKALMGWRDAATIERPRLAQHVAAAKAVLVRRLQRITAALPKPQ